MRLISQRLLMVGGLVMLLMGLVFSSTNVAAAPLLVLTPTAEPPTPTVAVWVPTETPTPLPTATPEPTLEPTATPEPTLEPTAVPDEQAKANPTISKSASPSEVKIGDTVTFTLLVRNRGDATAKDVVVRDSISDVFDIQDVVSSRGDVSVNGRNVSVDIGSLAPNEQVTIKIVVVVNANATAPTASNTARVSTSNNSNNPKDDQDTVTISIITDSTLNTGEEITPEPTPADSIENTGEDTGSEDSNNQGSNDPGSNASTPTMPRTGSEDAPNAALFLVIGILAISASLVLRWRASQE